MACGKQGAERSECRLIDQLIPMLADAHRVDDQRHGGSRSANRSATQATVSSLPSMPTFTASTPMSSTTLRNCVRIASTGSGQIPAHRPSSAQSRS